MVLIGLSGGRPILARSQLVVPVFHRNAYSNTPREGPV
jgi:hypothetical protein